MPHVNDVHPFSKFIQIQIPPSLAKKNLQLKLHHPMDLPSYPDKVYMLFIIIFCPTPTPPKKIHVTSTKMSDTSGAKHHATGGTEQKQKSPWTWTLGQVLKKGSIHTLPAGDGMRWSQKGRTAGLKLGCQKGAINCSPVKRSCIVTKLQTIHLKRKIRILRRKK